MKVRTGFVSNSSTVSFVIDKYDVGKNNMKDVREFLQAQYDTIRLEGSTYDGDPDFQVHETKKHFFGTRSMHNTGFRDGLKKFGVIPDEEM